MPVILMMSNAPPPIAAPISPDVSLMLSTLCVVVYLTRNRHEGPCDQAKLDTRTWIDPIFVSGSRSGYTNTQVSR